MSINRCHKIKEKREEVFLSESDYLLYLLLNAYKCANLKDVEKIESEINTIRSKQNVNLKESEGVKLFSREQLLAFNEKLLGRGMPVQQDGIGYNKADYSACATYYNGLSDGQLTDLAKRLIKYSETQLGIDKEIMKKTYEKLALESNGKDRSVGVSIDVGEKTTSIYFRYNENFINSLKKSKRCKYEKDCKKWSTSNRNIIAVLKMLENVGADVKNAIAYAEKNIDITSISGDSSDKTIDKIIDIIVKSNENVALLKFDYDDDILKEIKKIDKTERYWNSKFKFWTINLSHLDNVLSNLPDSLVCRYR